MGNGQPQSDRNDEAAGGGMMAPGRGRLSAESARQMRAEAMQRLNDAQALRSELAGSGRLSATDLRDLDNAINGMRQLAGTGAYRNAQDLARIQQDVVAGMARFEYGLRRSLGGDTGEKVFLPTGSEVPAGFRSLVDAYFRSLARQTVK
jgi:hypothetical protein